MAMSPYPVCCTTERIPIPTLERFLNDALSGSERLVRNSDYQLGIIDVSDFSALSVHTTASRPPLPPSPFPWPFHSAEDASRYIVDHASRYNGEALFFVVLDEQSLRDDTASLVARDVDGAVQTVRVTFDSAQFLLIALDVGILSFEEIQDIVGSSGDVCGTSENEQPAEEAWDTMSMNSEVAQYPQ